MYVRWRCGYRTNNVATSLVCKFATPGRQPLYAGHAWNHRGALVVVSIDPAMSVPNAPIQHCAIAHCYSAMLLSSQMCVMSSIAELRCARATRGAPVPVGTAPVNGAMGMVMLGHSAVDVRPPNTSPSRIHRRRRTTGCLALVGVSVTRLRAPDVGLGAQCVASRRVHWIVYSPRASRDRPRRSILCTYRILPPTTILVMAARGTNALQTSHPHTHTPSPVAYAI